MVLDACWEGLARTRSKRPAAVEPVARDAARRARISARRASPGRRRRSTIVRRAIARAVAREIPRRLRPTRAKQPTRFAPRSVARRCWSRCPGSAWQDKRRCRRHEHSPLATSSLPAWRDALVSTGTRGHRAIRTAEWCLRQGTSATRTDRANSATSSRGELYVRPDDRWEANDVAKLCPDVVETLVARDGRTDCYQRQEPTAQANGHSDRTLLDRCGGIRQFQSALASDCIWPIFREKRRCKLL